MGLDFEFLNLHEGRCPRGTAKPLEHETFAYAAGMREVCGVKLLKSDCRRESLLQRLGYALLRKRPTPCDREAGSYRGQDEENDENQCRFIMSHRQDVPVCSFV